MSDSAPSLLGRVAFYGLSWLMTALLAYGAGQFWPRRGEEPPAILPIPAHPAAEVVIPASEAVPLPGVDEATGTALTWAQLRPDIGLGPDFNEARQRLLVELMTEVGTSRAMEWMERYVETLDPSAYPALLEAMRTQAAGQRKDGMLHHLFAQWAQQDWYGAEEALASLPPADRFSPAQAMAYHLADGQGNLAAIRWASQQMPDNPWMSTSLAMYGDPSPSFDEQIAILGLIAAPGSVDARQAAGFLANRYLEGLTDPDAVITLYEHLPFEPGDDVTGSFMEAIVTQDTARARALAERLQDPAMRADALSAIEQIEAEAQTNVTTGGGPRWTVSPGDTAARIAREAGISVEELQNANPDVDFRRLQVGQEIVLPIIY